MNQNGSLGRVPGSPQAYNLYDETAAGWGRKEVRTCYIKSVSGLFGRGAITYQSRACNCARVLESEEYVNLTTLAQRIEQQQQEKQQQRGREEEDARGRRGDGEVEVEVEMESDAETDDEADDAAEEADETEEAARGMEDVDEVEAEEGVQGGSRRGKSILLLLLFEHAEQLAGTIARPRIVL